MNRFHVHKGDEVEVISGSQKGRKGRILEVKTDSFRALIEGVNLIKKHVRPTEDKPKGGVMEREGTIAICNLRLVNRPKAARTEKKKKESKGKK